MFQIDTLEWKTALLGLQNSNRFFFQETLKLLKSAVSKSARKIATNNNGDKALTVDNDANGWDGFDDEVEFDENDVDGTDVDGNDFSSIETCAQLSVDLKKAQTACEQLAEQLTKAEAQRDQVCPKCILKIRICTVYVWNRDVRILAL